MYINKTGQQSTKSKTKMPSMEKVLFTQKWVMKHVLQRVNL